jgi:hypothetical protein
MQDVLGAAFRGFELLENRTRAVQALLASRDCLSRTLEFVLRHE